MEELLNEYALAHSSAESAELRAIDRAAHVRLLQPRMVCGHQQALLLQMLVRLIAPRYVLELGAYSGYSTLAMAEALERDGAEIHSIEQNEELQLFLNRYASCSPHWNKVVMHYGSALDWIPRLVKKYAFEMVYIDADKREYPDYYEALIESLPSGALIVADNTLWSGKVIEPTLRGKDKQLDGILRMNEMVRDDHRVEKILLPLRDGITLIRKK